MTSWMTILSILFQGKIKVFKIWIKHFRIKLSASWCKQDVLPAGGTEKWGGALFGHLFICFNVTLYLKRGWCTVTTRCCLGCVVSVIVLLEGEISAQSEVLSALDQDFMKDICVLCSVQPFCPWKTPPPCFTVGMILGRWWAVPGFLQTWCLELRPNSWFHQTRESCVSQSESPLAL